MKSLKNKFITAFALVAIIIAGCKKENPSPSNGNNSGTYVAPSLAKDTLIKVPQQMMDKAKSDYNLAQGIIYIDLINGISSELSGAFFYDQSEMSGWASSTNSDGSTSYSWKYMQYTYKLSYYHSSTESWWKYEWDSTSYSYPYYYILDKGNSGEIDWYSQINFKSPHTLAYKDVWSISGNTTNATLNTYNTDGTINTQYVSASNKDLSGNLKIYSQIDETGPLVLQWYFIWDKSGSGSYTYYNSDGTTINFTGTF